MPPGIPSSSLYLPVPCEGLEEAQLPPGALRSPPHPPPLSPSTPPPFGSFCPSVSMDTLLSRVPSLVLRLCFSEEMVSILSLP